MQTYVNLNILFHFIQFLYIKGDNSNIKKWSAIFVVDTCGLHLR